MRATLEGKVRDLAFRAAEYDAEANAVGACGRVLSSVAALRDGALTAAAAAAADDEIGPGRYCSPRHRMRCKSRKDGATCLSMTRRAMGLVDITRHVM